MVSSGAIGAPRLPRRLLERPARVLGLSALPLGLRLQLLSVPLHFRLLALPAYRRLVRHARAIRHRGGRRGERRVALDGLHLVLPADRSYADLGAIYEVFVAEDYRTDYSGAVVVDLGGHRGFFGAYALLHGAAEVVSYEPASANFGSLSRAAASVDGRLPGRWRPVNAAVGGRQGEIELHTSGDSWRHSILDRPGMAAGTETVRMVALADVLADARGLAGRRVVVKIDVEGAECDMVGSTPPDAWDGVDEVLMEVHGFAPCPPRELVDRLSRAGLRTEDAVPAAGAGDFDHAVLRFRRAGAAP